MNEPDATQPQLTPPNFDDPNATTARPSDAPASGLPVIPGYDLLPEIARGGMGVVYAARDRAFGREVAVKVMLPGMNAAEFVREARITGRLPHPGLPPVYALGTLPDGRPFLAMKLIRGHTLDKVLKARTDLSADRGKLLAAFEQMCQAVGYAHAQGIIHRDLKPSNVMVGAFGEVQVMDWGLAKELRSAEPEPTTPASTSTPEDIAATVAGTIKGTPAYMAPEQARGEPVDARADVFALGGLLTAILTGKPLFVGDSVMDTIIRAAQADLGDTFDRLDACGADVELVELAVWCLEARAADRPADGAELAAAVAAYRAEVEERLRRAERDRAASEAKAEEQRKRRRVQFALAAVVMLLVGTGAGFAWWQDKQASQAKIDKANYDAAKSRLDAEAQAQAAAEAQRRTSNEHAIGDLLALCEQALGREQAETAALALDQAKSRIDNDVSGKFRTRYERCRADLTLLKDLDDVENKLWTIAEGRYLDYPRAVAALPLAFQRFGFVPGETPRDQAIPRMRESFVRERLLRWLDQWHIWNRSEVLPLILTAVDPDPYRDAIRDALRRNDKAEVAKLAARPEALEQPARFFATYSWSDIISPDRWDEILRATHTRQPDNGLLTMFLSTAGRPGAGGGKADRVRWSQAAVALRPNYAICWDNLGLNLIAAKDMPGAETAFKKAAELQPDSALFHVHLGNAILAQVDERDTADKQGKRARAMSAYQRAVQLAPNDASAHFSLGQVYEELKDWNRARVCFEQVLRIAPNFQPAKAALDRVKRKIEEAVTPPQR